MSEYRILALTTLPHGTRHERKIAREFEEALFAHGWSQLQEGVFTRVARGHRNARTHMSTLRENAPEVGTVRLFMLTEQQFEASEVIAGAEDAQESEIGAQADVFL